MSSIRKKRIVTGISILIIGLFGLYSLLPDREVKTGNPTEDQFLSEIISLNGSCSEKWSYAKNYSLLTQPRDHKAIEVLAMASYENKFSDDSCSENFKTEVELYCDDNLQELAKRHFGSYASRGEYSVFNTVCQEKIQKLIKDNPHFNSVVNFYSLDSDHPWMKFRQDGEDHIVKINDISSILSIPDSNGFYSILVQRKGFNTKNLYLVFTQESAYVNALDNISKIYAKSSLKIDQV
jgi:hypothetical protein